MINLSQKRAAIARSQHGNDASLEFRLTEDHMAAFISAYYPPSDGGSPLTIEIMKRELDRAGYGGQLDIDAANFALKRLKEGKSIINVALIRGHYPHEPEDSEILTDANLKHPVVPGLVFGKLRPPQKSKPGKTIDGEIIDPVSSKQPSLLKISSKSGCSLDKDSGELKAERYGLVKVHEGEIFIEPLITVSENLMAVTATFYGFDCFGSHISLRQIESGLREMGISRPVQHIVGETALKKARETKTPQEAVIVKGTEPQPGKDGWFEYARDDINTVGTEVQGDRVDYRERGVHPMVTPGEIIGKIHPPVEGKPGEDVYGKMTPPPGGNPLLITPGDSVEPLPDGVTYKATATGVVDLKHNVLSVCDILVTDGDVDYSTGNIRLESGSVQVTGNVREGFAVEVPDHVLVKHSIEGSNITAGKDIEVAGGIVMNDKGLVKAGGSVTAHFASNAHIECGGDLIIASDISNSTIRARGIVLATSGKGVVQGGTITTLKGVEVNELGSDIGVKTVVSIISSPPNNEKLITEREELRNNLLKINQSIGEDSDDIILASTPEDKKEMMNKILLMRAQTRMKLKDVRRRITSELSVYYNQLENMSVKVRRVAYPGIVIRIGGKTLQLSKPVNRVRFYFDATKKEILAADL